MNAALLTSFTSKGMGLGWPSVRRGACKKGTQGLRVQGCGHSIHCLGTLLQVPDPHLPMEILYYAWCSQEECTGHEDSLQCSHSKVKVP